MNISSFFKVHSELASFAHFPIAEENPVDTCVMCDLVIVIVQYLYEQIFNTESLRWTDYTASGLTGDWKRCPHMTR